MTEFKSAEERKPLWSLVARITVVIGVFAAAILLSMTLLGDGRPSEMSTRLGRITAGVGISIAVILTVVLLTRQVDRRPLREIGWTGFSHALRGFVIGATTWLLLASASFTAFVLLGASFEIAVPPAEFWAIVGLVLVAVLLAEALPEELAFRGYVTRVLGERLRGWWIIITQAALFTATAWMLRGMLSLSDLSLFIAMGIGLGYLRLVTGSVWVVVGFHMAFQTGAQLLLTHEVIEFGGSPLQATLGTGAIPFGVSVIIIVMLVSRNPGLFAPQHPVSPRVVK
jgi:membrane protease YdiL (CAAX protease family)